MKRDGFVVATFLGLLLVHAVAPAYAQAIKVEIPFDFVAAKATLPAGEYRVDPNQPTQGMLRLVSSKGSAAICFTQGIESAQPSNSTKLVFNRYGNHYFLSQVWSVGNNLGRVLPPSQAEREIARSFSKPEKEILTASK
jgi:hypothetical protein